MQLPERQSPYVDLPRATRRRNYVLQRMADVGYISQADADAAKAEAGRREGAARARRQSPAPYFVEEVRKYLERTYGAKKLYEQGLTVETSLDLPLQEAANAAVDAGLRRLDKRRGFRDAEAEHRRRRPFARGSSPSTAGRRPHARGRHRPRRGARARLRRRAPGARAAAGTIRLRMGAYTADLPKAGYAWTRKTTPAFPPRRAIWWTCGLQRWTSASARATVDLEQTPAVEGALLAIDNHTGQVRAMVGGFSFAHSKFNRAVQARRQLGSTFKPIVYTAAIDRGFTPASMLMDAPVAYPAGPGQPLYSPQNYDHTFKGPITLRYALEQSRNVPTVRLLEQLGPRAAIQYAKRLGFSGEFQPYLSIALGSAEATLLEVTSAYAVFPNQGVRMRPYDVLRVLDRDGSLLEENRPEPREAIRADTAYVMTNLLRGVTQRGTAAAASALDWPIAGKTGTVDDYTDAWFIGFDPDITIGVWVGHDEKKPLGPGETGAQAALPIWMDVMKAYIARRGREKTPEFAPPGNIVFLAVDKSTGAPAGDATQAINEAFISGHAAWRRAGGAARRTHGAASRARRSAPPAARRHASADSAEHAGSADPAEHAARRQRDRWVSPAVIVENPPALARPHPHQRETAALLRKPASGEHESSGHQRVIRPEQPRASTSSNRSVCSGRPPAKYF